jgi:ketosteroid isomerase-like protein
MDGVAVVQQFFVAFNDRDIEATLALVHSQVEFRPLKVHGVDVWHGRDGVAELWKQMRELGLDHRIDVAEVRERAEGEYAVLGTVRPGDTGFVGLYRLEDGLVRDVRHYFADEETRRRLGVG